MTFTSSQADAITAATAKFSAGVTDPKASIITTYNYIGSVRLLVNSVVDDILISLKSSLLFHCSCSTMVPRPRQVSSTTS